MINIRGMEPNDVNFIYSTWLRGLKFGNEFFEKMDSDSYYASKKEEVTAAMCQPDVTVRVACSDDDKEVILGYLVAQLSDEGTNVLWVWVRPAVRYQRVATKLAHGLSIKYVGTYTKVGEVIATKKGWKLKPIVLKWNNKE